jgi:hypothetical protein
MEYQDNNHVAFNTSDSHNSNANLNLRIRKKLVIVGDGFCGKTALLMVHSGIEFPIVRILFRYSYFLILQFLYSYAYQYMNKNE